MFHEVVRSSAGDHLRGALSQPMLSRLLGLVYSVHPVSYDARIGNARSQEVPRPRGEVAVLNRGNARTQDSQGNQGFPPDTRRGQSLGSRANKSISLQPPRREPCGVPLVQQGVYEVHQGEEGKEAPAYRLVRHALML